MSNEPSDGQVAALAILGIVGILILALAVTAFGIFTLYASISAFVAGNIWAGILWGIYPWFVLSGGSKEIADRINNRK